MNARTRNIDDEMSNLVEHIKIHGLVEPLVVFAVNEIDESNELYNTHKDFKDKYAILAGQRRFNASKILNEQFPGNGWDKIKCIVRDPPKDPITAKAISLGEGLTSLPFTLADSIAACDDLFKTYNDMEIVAEKTGISISLITRYVKFNRLPDLLKDNLPMIHKNNKVAVNIAVEAADALCWTRYGDVSEEKVLELAKALGNAKRTSHERYKKLRRAAEEFPNASLDIIEDKSLKMMDPIQLIVTIDAKHRSILKKLAEENGRDPDDELSDLFSLFLDSKLEDD